MNFKKAYCYVFYKFYKALESINGNFWSDWKAIATIMALELFLIASIYLYYLAYFDPLVHKLNYGLIIPILLIGILVPNYYIFEFQDRWKKYVKEFDKWSKKKNRTGGLIVWPITILIVINYIYSIYVYQHSSYFFKMTLYNNVHPIK